jgi:aquaporin Z
VTIIPTPSLPARVFAEFLGTFWVVLAFGLNTVLSTGAIAWSVAGAFISMTYALGSVSGAHFNPAVTLAIMLSGRGRCSRKEGFWFMIAQFVAAIPGGLIAASAIPKLWNPSSWSASNDTMMPGYMPTSANATNLTTALTDIGLFAGYSRYNWYEIGLVETIFTFLLAYVVLVVSTSELHTISVSKSWPNFYFALAIGLAIAGVVYAAGPVSGGYLNPAVALSFAVEGEPSFATAADVAGWPWLANALIRFITSLVKGIRYYLAIFWYVIPEFLGAGLAALLFRLTHAAEYPKKDSTNM